MKINTQSLFRKYVRDFLYSIYPSRPIQFCLNLFIVCRKYIVVVVTKSKREGFTLLAEHANNNSDFHGYKASLIFSRTIWDPNHPHNKVGSGRMQQEVFTCLQKLGFDTEFAGFEDRSYSKRIIQADLIISLPSALARISRQVKGVSGIYTCNTHILVRNQRLVEASRRWHIPCEYYPRVFSDLKAYREADYLLIAENDRGIANFTRNGLDIEKIKRYNNCIDDDIWIPADTRKDVFTFVFWASFVGLRKGIPALVKAWQRWFTDQNAELHLFGAPTPASDILFNGQIQGSPLPGLYLHLNLFPAQDPSIIKFLGSAHVGILPTLEDAQPSSLLEMASCGLPIITTHESGVQFNDDFCKYIPPDSLDDLCESFQYWYARRDNISEAGNRARLYIQHYHTWNHFRNKFPDIIREMMT